MTTESLTGKADNNAFALFFQVQKEEARGLFSPFSDQSSSSIYEGCSNMNASSFITFFTYMLRQNGKRLYKGLYVTPPEEKYSIIIDL